MLVKLKSAVLLFAFLLLLSVAHSMNDVFQKKDSFSIEGRWDMTINMDGKDFPSWLEVRHSGYHTLVGDLVGVWGSARPVSLVNFTGGKISFSLPPQWEKGDKDM